MPRHFCSVPGCSKSYGRPYQLEAHKIGKHSTEPRKFRCTLCPNAYIWPSDLQDHLRHKHPSEGRTPVQVSCPACGKSYSSMRVLKRHNTTLSASTCGRKRKRSPEDDPSSGSVGGFAHPFTSSKPIGSVQAGNSDVTQAWGHILDELGPRARLASFRASLLLKSFLKERVSPSKNTPTDQSVDVSQSDRPKDRALRWTAVDNEDGEHLETSRDRPTTAATMTLTRYDSDMGRASNDRQKPSSSPSSTTDYDRTAAQLLRGVETYLSKLDDTSRTEQINNCLFVLLSLLQLLDLAHDQITEDPAGLTTHIAEICSAAISRSSNWLFDMTEQFIRIHKRDGVDFSTNHEYIVTLAMILTANSYADWYSTVRGLGFDRADAVRKAARKTLDGLAQRDPELSNPNVVVTRLGKMVAIIQKDADVSQVMRGIDWEVLGLEKEPALYKSVGLKEDGSVFWTDKLISQIAENYFYWFPPESRLDDLVESEEDGSEENAEEDDSEESDSEEED